MFLRPTLLLFLALVVPLAAHETFVGSFAEPKDGGNLDTTLSSFDGTTVVIVPRAHASEAIGGATRWRNIHFAVRGMRGKAPVFRLPLMSPGSRRMILSGNAVSFEHLELVWSYEPNATKWNAFDTHVRSGAGASTWRVEAHNAAVFTEDVVYVSINERFPVGDFYEWLEAKVFTHPLVKPTASETKAGTFMIGFQSGAPASAAFSRTIPDMPLYGFTIKDPAAKPTKLVVLVSGQHPYEGQTKAALQGAIDWILNSKTAEAAAYRAEYVTVVYPFVNPTGELAGLWRGTAFDPSVDTNRHWHTSERVPARARGIDTVIVHKNAMLKDIAAIGLGEPYAVFDYHQSFGESETELDYVLHASLSLAPDAPAARQGAVTEFAPYFARLNTQAPMAGRASDLTSQQTLRGLMVARGVKLPLTFERSVYHTIESERAFGVATVCALVDSVMVAAVAPAEVGVAAASVEPVRVAMPATAPTGFHETIGFGELSLLLEATNWFSQTPVSAAIDERIKFVDRAVGSAPALISAASVE